MVALLVFLDLDLFLVAFLAAAFLVLAILKKDEYIVPDRWGLGTEAVANDARALTQGGEGGTILT